MTTSPSKTEQKVRLKMGHTPEPWTLRAVSCSAGCCHDLQEVTAQYPEDSEPNRPIATVNGGNAVWLREGESEANAHRIVACVNAMAGIKDPEAAIEKLKALAATARLIVDIANENANPNECVEVRFDPNGPLLNSLREALEALK